LADVNAGTLQVAHENSIFAHFFSVFTDLSTLEVYRKKKEKEELYGPARGGQHLRVQLYPGVSAVPAGAVSASNQSLACVWHRAAAAALWQLPSAPWRRAEVFAAAAVLRERARKDPADPDKRSAAPPASAATIVRGLKHRPIFACSMSGSPYSESFGTIHCDGGGSSNTCGSWWFWCFIARTP
jgi:hypothetical protein